MELINKNQLIGLKDLSVFKFHDVSNLTLQKAAQLINNFHINVLIVFQSVQLSSTDVVLCNEFVLVNVLFF